MHEEVVESESSLDAARRLSTAFSIEAFLHMNTSTC
jgi:hypothetical protein